MGYYSEIGHASISIFYMLIDQYMDFVQLNVFVLIWLLNFNLVIWPLHCFCLNYYTEIVHHSLSIFYIVIGQYMCVCWSVFFLIYKFDLFNFGSFLTSTFITATYTFNVTCFINWPSIIFKFYIRLKCYDWG